MFDSLSIVIKSISSSKYFSSHVGKYFDSAEQSLGAFGLLRRQIRNSLSTCTYVRPLKNKYDLNMATC